MKMEKNTLGQMVLRELEEPIFIETVQGGVLKIEMHGNGCALTVFPSSSKRESQDLEIDMRTGGIHDGLGEVALCRGDGCEREK